MNPRTIETIHEMEAKWQKTWAEAGTYTAKTGNPAAKQDKFYGLVEFPYPSGEGLHVGHPRSYTAIDLVTRKRRMEGKNVLYPMGWDAFGLPTENFAIKHKIRPADATKRNIGNFTRQIKSLGFGFDWTREVDTTDPKYYKWTQWQFLQFVKAGLAYKAKSTINWCPKCKIGLANEEAQGGVCERCGSPVEKREKAQWMIKISKYADRLIDDLQTVDYLDKIAAQQVNWIGRSEGAEIAFRIPRFKKLLVATNNKSKFYRVKILLTAVLPSIEIVSPEDIGLEAIEVKEGSNMRENASLKAAAYAKLTDLPILGMDSGLFIQGEPDLDPTSPKRNALGDVDESTLTQEEKAGKMDAFWRGIAAKHGGEVEGYWHDISVLRLPDGTEICEEDKREIILTDHREGKMDIYLPVRGLYRVKSTGQYVADMIHDEEIHVELGPFTHALKKLCSEEVRVFTTRPDTLFGVTYVTLAPEHGLVQQWLNQDSVQNADAVRAYIETVKGKTDMERTAETKEKTGIALEGIYVINPANGQTVPVWIADYVLAGYGTGAVMAVPAHDERDFAFAKQHGLPIRHVVFPDQGLGVHVGNTEQPTECFTSEGMTSLSGFLNDLKTAEAKEVMISWLETHNAGKRLKTYKLRDWVFSRQRYWGEPIPLVHCEACAKKKQKALLIHGFSGSAEKGWFPSIKAELEAQGYEVFAPSMSMTGGPTVEVWMELLKPYMEQLGEDDVVVGHSIGARAAVEMLERTGKKIDRLVLVAPAIGEYPVARYEQRLKDEPQRKADFDFLREFWRKPIDWKRVESLVGSAVVMWSSDDAIIQKPTHTIYPAGWLLQSYEGKGHFQEADQPELLEHIVAHKTTGWIPVPDAQLPVTLPEVEAYEPTDTGESPLAKIDAWVNTTCPKCGGPATRETDTMPNWAGSSWYFLRYCDPQNDQQFASPEALKYWLPIDLYNGGMEHTTLHLLYSRFWHKFLYDMGYIPEECGSEPYAMRRSHDMILGEGGVKMSKSKGNVVNPDDVVKEYGADVFRLYEMFIGPYDQKAPWDTNGVEGVRRFMDRVWYVFHQPQVTDRAVPSDLETLYHQTIKKVTDGIDNLQFNTPVSQMMILANAYQEFGCVPTAHRDGFMQVLAPYAPHVAEELWQEEGHTFSIHRAGWPTYDTTKLVSDTFELVIQVNGKVRDKVTVPQDISEEAAKKLALESEAVQKWLGADGPKKVVYVKGRLVSVVV
ncbi:class I tRNA ligase family protein [Patescibacteria group bacterium]|nr:class I tRNA ligase family protein [Patescibacteria group bacterium]